jgi:hypothetical protein
MANYIIDGMSGTVLRADQCYLVDIDSLADDDYELLAMGSDTEVAQLAERVGRKVED